MTNKVLVNKDDGVILAVTSTKFLTSSSFVPPTLVEVEGESCVDTTLYQPLSEVVERCERAGMLRDLIGGAQGLQYDSKEEISDDVLDSLVPVSGDFFQDVNDVMAVFDAAQTVSSDFTEQSKDSATPVAEEASKATSEPENASDNVEE